MTVRILSSSHLAWLPLALSLFAAAPAHAQKSLDYYCQPELKDVRAGIEVASKNERELRKIGKGYVDAYKLGSQVIMCKEPHRVRFQGKSGLLDVSNVTNGSRKLFEVPFLHIRKVEDLSKEPGKADSIIRLGVITSSFLSRVQSRWLRTEERGGKAVQVFEFWFPEDPRFKNEIWVDPSTKTIVEHIAHHRNPQAPGFKKRFVYAEPRKVNGVWLPTQVSLYNGENRLAAVMRYNGVQVNTGLQDRLFTF
jgi:hypothetical protein